MQTLNWRNWYSNNVKKHKKGIYALITYELFGSSTKGIRYSIKSQKIDEDTLLECHIVFIKEYGDITGDKDYKEPAEFVFGCNRGVFNTSSYFETHTTLSNLELNDEGRVLKVFSSLEEAKSYVQGLYDRVYEELHQSGLLIAEINN